MTLYLLPLVYLLVGTLIARALHVLSHGFAPRRELVLVALFWPVFVVVCLESLLLILLEKRHG